MSRRPAGVVGERDLLLLNAEHAALRRDLAGDLDLAADERVEQVGRRIERIGPERQVPEQFGQRRLAGQADGADRPFLVEDRQALENVVDLVEPHRKLNGGASGNRPGVDELGKARTRQHDARERQFRRTGAGGQSEQHARRHQRSAQSRPAKLPWDPRQGAHKETTDRCDIRKAHVLISMASHQPTRDIKPGSRRTLARNRSGLQGYHRHFPQIQLEVARGTRLTLRIGPRKGRICINATSEWEPSCWKHVPRRSAENEFAQPRMAVAAHHDHVGAGIGRMGQDHIATLTSPFTSRLTSTLRPWRAR